MADGSFVALAQSGNMTAMTTPYDEEIARTSAEIGSTVITYGDAKKQEESRSKVAKAAGAPSTVAADRAAYNLASGGKAIQGTGDLVEDLREGRVDLGRLPLKQLPLELQGMSPAQRKEYVASQQARRDALNARLAELSEKRADYALKERRAAAGQRRLRHEGLRDHIHSGRAGAIGQGGVGGAPELAAPPPLSTEKTPKLVLPHDLQEHG